MTEPYPPALRLAGHRDSDDLLTWRNDAATRANSRNTGEIAQPAHEAWLDRALADPRRRIWIAERDGRKLGTVSAVETAGGAVEMAITVAPLLRGGGIGGGILRAGLSEARRTWPESEIRAVVRAANTASRRLFESCGFVAVGEADGFVTYRLAA